LNDAWVFHIAQKIWQEDVRQNDTRPSPRSGHTLETITYADKSDAAVLFGGNASGVLVDELWMWVFHF
jgi:hypothetical protein